jgi:hypothetical protein
VTLDAGMSATFTGTGGTPPYTFSLVSGGGSIGATSGAYSTPSTAGSAVVQLSDAAGKQMQANITIDAAVGVTAITTVDGGTTQTLQGTGGQGPYTYAIVSGPGSVNASSGVFTAPASAGTTVVRVTDANGGVTQVTILNNPALSITPPSITVTAGAGQTMQFSAQGGSGGYTYALSSGPGTLSAAGLYTAVNTSGTAMVQVTDSLGTTATASVRALRIRVNNLVTSAVTDGTNWYLGGYFDAVNPYSAPGLAIIDASSGDPILACDLGSGFLGGTVTAVAASSTAIYVGGSFSSYRGSIVSDLVKLDPTTCALDATFNASGGFNANGVSALLLTGSSLYVAGGFTSYRGAAAPGLVKLDRTTGALDPSFSGATGFDIGPTALAMVDSALYAGGSFSTYRGAPAAYLAKLDAATGVLDTTFAAAVRLNNTVSTLAASGTALYASGFFTMDGTQSVVFAKIDPATGALDPVFTQNAGTYPGVDAIGFLGSSLYIGSNSPFSGFAQLAKLDAGTGVADGTFTNSNALALGVTALTVYGSSVYFGGNFNSYLGANAHHLAKVDAITGVLDTAFTQATGPNGAPSSIVAQGSKILAAGTLSTYRGQAVGNVTKIAVATDAIDPTFAHSLGASNGFVSWVQALALSNSSLFVAGNFNYFNGTLSSNIAKVDPVVGSADATFTAGNLISGIQSLWGTSSALFATTTSNNCSSTIGGCLTKIDPSSGSFAAAFAASATTDAAVWTILGLGSSLYLGGSFTQDHGLPASGLAKVDPNTAAVDQTFTSASGIGPSNAASVRSLAVSGSSLYVGGNFSLYQGSAVGNLIKIDAATGALDSTFSQSAGAGGIVVALAAANGALYFGGQLSGYRGAAVGNLGKVDLATGVLDTTFTHTNGFSGGAPIGYAVVDTLTPVGSKLFVGGSFNLYRGSPAYFFVPVDATSGALLDP